LAARGMDTRRLQHFLDHASITNTVRYNRDVAGALQGYLALISAHQRRSAAVYVLDG
jgi:hypothetical protein